METIISRRKFLQLTGMATGCMLAGGTAMFATAGASSGAQLAEVDAVRITVLVDNYFESMRPSTDVVTRFSSAKTSLHAEHGLAYYIETTVNGRTYHCMFDYGMDYYGLKKNAELLEVDLSRVEALGLSHGHRDHWNNLLPLIKEQQGRLLAGIPLYVGTELFENRYVRRNNSIIAVSALKRADIEALGVVRIIEVTTPTAMVPGAYLSGTIKRTTSYEQGMASALIRRGDNYIQDKFPGEQALLFNLRNKGLVVVTSCAHAGIVNTVRHAHKISGVQKLHAVLGGFHLIGASPALVARTVSDIQAMQPDWIVPMHCTGFEGAMAFARAMPEQFILSMAGSRYSFTA